MKTVPNRTSERRDMIQPLEMKQPPGTPIPWYPARRAAIRARIQRQPMNPQFQRQDNVWPGRRQIRCRPPEKARKAAPTVLTCAAGHPGHPAELPSLEA